VGISQGEGDNKEVIKRGRRRSWSLYAGKKRECRNKMKSKKNSQQGATGKGYQERGQFSAKRRGERRTFITKEKEKVPDQVSINKKKEG